MQFKTSFFSPALFAHNLKRFWPLMVAVFVAVMLFPGTGILWAHTPGATSAEVLSRTLDAVYIAEPVMVFLMVPGAFISALLVFDHLRKRSKMRFYHGLPLTRLASFATRYACGFVLIALPILVGLLVCMGLATMVGAPQAVGDIARLFGVSLACLLLFFSLAAISCVVCGNALGTILVYIALNCAVSVVLVGFNVLITALMPGIDIRTLFEGPARWLTPASQFADGAMIDKVYSNGIIVGGNLHDLGCVLVYAVVGLVVLGLATWLYQIRRDELAGETVAFKAVKVVCKVLFALVVSAVGTPIVLLVGSVYTSAGTEVGTVLVSHIVFAVIGWIVAEMIVGRTLKVANRRTAFSCGVLAATILVVSGLLYADVLGIVHKVPAAQSVSAAEVQYRDRTIAMDPQDAGELHANVLDILEADGSRGLPPQSIFSSSDSNTIGFDYTMNDGSTMHRSYSLAYAVDDNPLEEVLASAFDTPRYTHELYFGAEPGKIDSANIESLSVYMYTTAAEGEQTEEYELEGALAYEFYQAVCEDIEKGRVSARDRLFVDTSLGNVNMTWKSSSQHEPALGVVDANFEIVSSMASTRAWLKAHKSEAVQTFG